MIPEEGLYEFLFVFCLSENVLGTYKSIKRKEVSSMIGNSYVTLLIREEYDARGQLLNKRIVDWKIDEAVCSVGDFPAQKLSFQFTYRTAGTFLSNISELFSYVKRNGMIWEVVPPQAQM